MRSLVNSVQLIGHLGNEVESIAIGGNKTLAKARLATDDVWYNKTGEKIKETSWHRLIAWGSTGERMLKMLTKGAKVAVKGKLRNNTYEDKSGQTRYTTEVVVNEFMVLKDAAEKPF